MTPFTFLWQTYNSALVTGVDGVVSHGLAAVAALMQGVLGLYVIVAGVAILLGTVAWNEVARTVLRALLVIAALTPAYFDQYIRDAFMQTIPDWIAQAVGVTTTGQASATQFDNLGGATWHMIAAAKIAAGGIWNIGAHVEIAFCEAIIYFALAACFLIYMMARAYIGLVVAIGPFVLPFFLFDRTQGVADRWVGKLIGLSVLMLLVTVLLQIVVAGDNAYMQSVAANASLAVMIESIWGVAEVFVFGAALMILLPATAAAIGGGVSFSPRAGFNAASAAAGAVGGTVAGAATRLLGRA